MSVSVVQAASGTGAGTTSALFGSAVASGNAILAVAAAVPAFTFQVGPTVGGTPTDNAGNTYHYVDGAVENAVTPGCASTLFDAYNVVGRGGLAVTGVEFDICCCGPTGSGDGALIVAEISGLIATNPADRAAINSGGTSTTSMSTGTTPTTAQANELLVAWLLCPIATSVTVTPPSGFTGMVRVNVLGSTEFALCIAFKTVSAIGAYSGTWTTSSPAALFTAGIAPFKAASGTIYTDTPSGVFALTGSLADTRTGADAPAGHLALVGTVAESWLGTIAGTATLRLAAAASASLRITPAAEAQLTILPGAGAALTITEA